MIKFIFCFIAGWFIFLDFQWFQQTIINVFDIVLETLKSPSQPLEHKVLTIVCMFAYINIIYNRLTK